MKNINFLLLVIAIVMTSSCTDTHDTSYSVEQMNCFVATGQAEYVPDSVVVIDDYGVHKLPYAMIEGFGYFPAQSQNGEARYYRADR